VQLEETTLTKKVEKAENKPDIIGVTCESDINNCSSFKIER